MIQQPVQLQLAVTGRVRRQNRQFPDVHRSVFLLTQPILYPLHTFRLPGIFPSIIPYRISPLCTMISLNFPVHEPASYRSTQEAPIQGYPQYYHGLSVDKCIIRINEPELGNSLWMDLCTP